MRFAPACHAISLMLARSPSASGSSRVSTSSRGLAEPWRRPVGPPRTRRVRTAAAACLRRAPRLRAPLSDSGRGEPLARAPPNVLADAVEPTRLKCAVAIIVVALLSSARVRRVRAAVLRADRLDASPQLLPRALAPASLRAGIMSTPRRRSALRQLGGAQSILGAVRERASPSIRRRACGHSRARDEFGHALRRRRAGPRSSRSRRFFVGSSKRDGLTIAVVGS